MQIGDKVKWSSQSQGSWKEKCGTFKMILEAEQDATVKSATRTAEEPV